MKTLKNTLAIALVAFSLGIVTAFADSGVKTSVNSAPEKAKKESEETLRKVIVDLLKNSTIVETGKVDILFKVDAKKQVVILNVMGESKTLVSSVKNYLSKSSIVVPEAEENKYSITATVNPVPETPNVVRAEIWDALNNAAISETGKVNIVFEVNNKKQVEILNVFGLNSSLVYAVKCQLNRHNLLVPNAGEGRYMVTANFK